jgi:hypothetical protein
MEVIKPGVALGTTCSVYTGILVNSLEKKKTWYLSPVFSEFETWAARSFEFSNPTSD